MPTLKPSITFARMRVEAQRLLSAARTDELRGKMAQLLHVFDLLERKFEEQPKEIWGKGYSFTVKDRRAQHDAFMAGREARDVGATEADNPFDEQLNMHLFASWRNGLRSS